MYNSAPQSHSHMWLVATAPDRAEREHFHQNAGSSLGKQLWIVLALSLWPLSRHLIELPVCLGWSDEWAFWIKGPEFRLSHNTAGIQLEIKPKYAENHPDTYQPRAWAANSRSTSTSFSIKSLLKNNHPLFVSNYKNLLGEKPTEFIESQRRALQEWAADQLWYDSVIFKNSFPCPVQGLKPSATKA